MNTKLSRVPLERDCVARGSESLNFISFRVRSDLVLRVSGYVLLLRRGAKLCMDEGSSHWAPSVLLLSGHSAWRRAPEG